MTATLAMLSHTQLLGFLDNDAVVMDCLKVLPTSEGMLLCAPVYLNGVLAAAASEASLETLQQILDTCFPDEPYQHKLLVTPKLPLSKYWVHRESPLAQMEVVVQYIEPKWRTTPVVVESNLDEFLDLIEGDSDPSEVENNIAVALGYSPDDNDLEDDPEEHDEEDDDKVDML